MLKNKDIKELSFIALIFVTFFWSFGFIATQIAIDAGCSTEMIIAARFGIGSLLMFAIRPKKVFASNKKSIIHGSIAGLIIFMAFYTQILGQNFSPISNVALIGSCYVLFVPFVSWIMLKKRPGIMSFILTAITLLGMFILNLSEEGLKIGFGDILTVTSAILFAIHVSYLSCYCSEDQVFSLTFFQLFSAFVIALIYILFNGSSISVENIQKGWMGLLYLGIFSTCICFFLQTFAQQHLPAVDVSIVLCLEGVFAAISSMLLGYENFRWNVLVGGAIILFCCIAVNLRIEKKPSASTETLEEIDTVENIH